MKRNERFCFQSGGVFVDEILTVFTIFGVDRRYLCVCGLDGWLITTNERIIIFRLQVL